VPLGFLISNAYGFQPYQFSPIDNCCQARFDITAKVPVGTTAGQFQRMQQNLLKERFKLAFHTERKEMPVFDLTVAEKGPRMKESAPGAAAAPQEPWTAPKFTMGDDGYPVFPPGRGGLIGMNGHYRWTGVGLPMQEIVKTLSSQLGRPVIDSTGLKGKYDFDMTWIVDIGWVRSAIARSGTAGAGPEGTASEPDNEPGPTLVSAVQNRLGLKLTSKKGPGDIVVVDRAEKAPVGD